MESQKQEARGKETGEKGREGMGRGRGMEGSGKGWNTYMKAVHMHVVHSRGGAVY